MAAIRSDPGNVSVKTMQVEAGKLPSIKAVELPPKLFSHIAPKILLGWQAAEASAVDQGAVEEGEQAVPVAL
jgi:hypothetical protein